MKIKDGSLGLWPPEALGEEGPDLHYFLLGDYAFASMPWMVKPYSQRQLTSEERIDNWKKLQRQEGGGKRLWNVSELNQGTTWDHGAKATDCQRHCVDVCGVAQHAEDTPWRGRQGTNPRKSCSSPTE